MTRRCIFIAFVAVLIIRGSVCRAASGPIIITPGQPLSIHCNLTNTEAEGAKVDWIKDGEDSNILITGAKYEVEENNNTLSIKEAEPDDAGAYECRAKDTSTNPYSQTFSVYFFELEELTKSTFVTVGGNVTLDCLARGKPIPTVQWLKDEQKLNDSKYVYLKNTYQITNAKLLITNITQQDLGNYTCQVFINEEVHKTTTQLTFKRKGSKRGAGENLASQFEKELTNQINNLDSKKAAEGQVTGAAETTQPPSSRQLPTSSSDMSTKEEEKCWLAYSILTLKPNRKIKNLLHLTNKDAINDGTPKINWDEFDAVKLREFKDGVKLNTDGNAKYTAFENGTLLINKAKRNVDVGIYMCKIEALTKQFSVIFNYTVLNIICWQKIHKYFPIIAVEGENRELVAVCALEECPIKHVKILQSPYVSLYPLGGIALEFAVLAVVIAFFERRQRRAMELANGGYERQYDD
ncbi:unnamed protein product, partial [Meganyctiphanes norvegica]